MKASLHHLSLFLAVTAAGRLASFGAEDVSVADFEGGNTVWSSQAGSQIDSISEEAAKSGVAGLKWTFLADGVNRYGNEVSAKFEPIDVTNLKALRFDFLNNGQISGRIACQLVNSAKDQVFDIGDINGIIEERKWTEVVLLLPSDIEGPIDGIRFFFDGIDYKDSLGLTCFLDNVRFTKSDAVSDSSSEKAISTELVKSEITFSELSAAEQVRIRLASAPKALSERVNPYSTPMYYPQWGGSSPDGTQRSDFQEAFIREFAELGMTKIHYNAYPSGIGTTKTSDVKYTLSEADKVGISELVRLCKKYGLKVGMRVDLPYILVPERNRPELSDPAVSFWQSNPRNPNNQINQYLGWLGEVVSLLKGNLQYIILGDEITDSDRDRNEAWTQADQIEVIKRCSEVIKQIDPNVLVSGFSASSGKINDILDLAKLGYGKYADAVAMNHYDYKVVADFLKNLKEISRKDFPLLSNGVGYISSNTTPRNPPKDPYSRYTDQDQASMIARTMYSWWNNGAMVAPYYVSVRSMCYKGNVQPLWYGFFGFMDFNIDQDEVATFKRYPGWYAFRTVANVFDDRPSFKDASFEVTPSNPDKLYLKAFERPGKDLTIMIWREDQRKVPQEISIRSAKYKYPVQIDLMNQEKFRDIKYEMNGNEATLHGVETGFRPTIVRLFRAQ